MRLRSCVYPGVLALALFGLEGSTALAQRQATEAAPPDIAGSISNLASNLADQPPTHIGFVFDRSMLQAARGVLESEGMTPERAAAALKSIAYDNYRYRQPAVYAPEAMASIVAAYRAAGWKHLVDAHDLSTTEGPHRRLLTDLWLHFSGSDIDGLTVMTRGVRDVNVIQVACDLRPLDLVHLGGHFGIPKVDPNAVMVPAPDGR